MSKKVKQTCKVFLLKGSGKWHVVFLSLTAVTSMPAISLTASAATGQ